MPEYTYQCEDCSAIFSIVCSISEYGKKNVKCENCKSKHTYRRYVDDVSTLNTSVKKSDNELKTIGDLALRNTERMSDDQKADLYRKHNSYKETVPEKPLPKGMSRIKKPPKTIWPGG
jgi:putative FmdB family regulatory protein